MKIMIVDDHPVLREGIAALFQHAASDTVVLKAASVAEALELVAKNPDLDVVLLDLVMPGSTGLPPIAEFGRAREDLPVIVLSSSEDPKDVRQALALGALGYVPKSASPQALLFAVKLVMGGDLYIPPLILGAFMSDASTGSRFPPGKKELLTQRQIEVLKLVAQGLPNKTISSKLELSEKTIKAHITSIFKVLNVVNRTQAATAGREAGLL